MCVVRKLDVSGRISQVGVIIDDVVCEKSFERIRL